MADVHVQEWADKWERNETKWHKPEVNEFLLRHARHLAPENKKIRIFVPLCGKTVDMKWLCERGYEVVGVDAVEKAIKTFFEEQQLEFETESVTGNITNVTLFKSLGGQIKIYCCDLFLCAPEFLGTFDAIWDRGSLVAIYAEDRPRYAQLIKSLLRPDYRYLIDSMVYDQSKFPGPPRSVPVDELSRLFPESEIQELETYDCNKDGMALKRWKLEICHDVIVLLTPKKT